MALLPPLVGELRVKASDVHVKFGEVMKASDDLAKKTTGDSNATGSAWDKLGRTSQVALSAMGAGIVGMIGTTGEMAGNFQENMTKLVTGAGVSKDAIGGISQGILAMAPEVQMSTDQLSSGMYMIASAGYKGAEGLDVLKASAEGAKVGGADLGTMANAVTSGLNAYHLKASDAAGVTNQLVATVSSGKMHMQDLADSLSAVLPKAASAGLGLDQVGGAMATMTGQGMSAQQASQDLANTISALQNPNSQAVAEMEQLGLSSTDVSQNLGKNGLTGTLATLTQAITAHMGPAGTVLMDTFKKSQAAASDAKTMFNKLPPDIQKTAQSFVDGTMTQKEWTQAVKAMTPEQANLAKQFAQVSLESSSFNDLLKKGGPEAQTYNAALAKMLGGTTGLNTGLMLTGKNAATFADNVKTIGAASASAGDQVTGFDDASQDMNSKMDGVRAKVEVLGIKIGTALIPMLSAMMDGAMAAFNFLDDHKAILITIAAIIGGVLSVVVVAWGIKFVETTKNVIEATSKVASSIAGGLGKGVGAIGKMASGFKSAAVAAGEWASTTTKAIAANSKELAINSLEWLKNTAATVSAKVAQIASTVATAAMTAGQWLLNAAMSANPIMIVVIAIAALVAALIWAYNNVGWFKDMVNAAWQFIQAAVKVVVDWFVGSVVPVLANVWNAISAAVTWLYDAIFKPYFDMIVAVVTVLVDFVTGTLVPGIEGAFQWIGSVVSGAVSFFTNFQQNAINAAAAVLTWFENLPGNLMNALADAGSWLLGVGQNIVQGLINGVQSMIGNVVSTIQNGIGGAVDAVKNALGIHSPSTVFHDIGRNTMLGYLNGIGSLSGDVSDALTSAVLPQSGSSGFTGGGFSPQPVSASQQGGSGGGAVINNYYNITVPVTTNADPNEIARELGWQLSQMK